MKKVKLRVKIEFEHEDAQVIGHQKSIELSADDYESVDACEQQLLDVSYDTMRKVLAEHLSAVSKKSQLPQVKNENMVAVDGCFIKVFANNPIEK